MPHEHEDPEIHVKTKALGVVECTCYPVRESLRQGLPGSQSSLFIQVQINEETVSTNKQKYNKSRWMIPEE